MVNFLRKNILFFAVTGVILVISLALAVVDIMMYGELDATKSQIAENSAKEEDLLKKDKKVHDANVKIFQKNKEHVLKEARKLQRSFSQPNRKYFLSFLKNLGLQEEKEQEVRDLFRKHFEDYRNDEKDMRRFFENFSVPVDNVIFDFVDSFKKKLALYLEPAKEGQDQENRVPSPAVLARVEKAFVAFIKEMIHDHATVEGLADSNFMDVKRIQYDVILEAFGLPRTMQAYHCQKYLEAMQIAFSKQRVIPGVTTLEKIREFTFDYQVTPPERGEVPVILVSMRIYEDIFRIMRGVDGMEISSLKLTPPPQNDDRYQKYRCQISFRAPLAGVRNLVNSFHDAYKDGRVCIVRWVSVKGSSDKELEELKKILQPAATAVREVSEETPVRRSRRNRNRRFRQNRGSQNVSLIAPYLDPSNVDYAKVLVGGNRNVDAEVDFDYVIYTGDQVYKHTKNN